MNRNSYRVIIIGVLVLAVGLFAGLTLARAEGGLFKPNAVGTSFTYQGQLDDGGSPANGSYDFQFGLYDDLTVGSQVGVTQTVSSVSVSDGLFTVGLDFGASVFTGGSRYLAIAVRSAGGGAYTALTPRQALSPVPYAIYADTTVWGGIADIPDGFADGVDNTGESLANVVTVAKAGGDFTNVQAALDSIGDASAENPYLVQIGPGIYTGTVNLKSYVDMEGSGEGVTILRSFGGSNAANSYTIGALGPITVEVRLLSVESDGTGQNAAQAINNASNDGLKLIQVTAAAFGASNDNYGVYNYDGSMHVSHLTAMAGGGNSRGVFNFSNSSMILLNSNLSGDNESIFNYINSTMQIVNSLVEDAVFSDSDLTCINAFNGSGQALDSNCQVIASGAVTWDDVDNVPLGFADGIDDVGSSIEPANIVWVATSGGDYTSIQTALNNISDASVTNPYLIRVAPGIYTETVDLKPYIDIEGSGEGVTMIRSFGGGTDPLIDKTSATLRATGTITAEVRRLTVESLSATNDYATGIWTSGAEDSLRFTHVGVQATGGVTYTIGHFNSNASPAMNHLNISCDGAGGLYNACMYNYDGSAPAMNHINVNAFGSAGENRAMVNDLNSSPVMQHVNATTDGGFYSIAFTNFENSSPLMINIIARATGGSNQNYGVLNRQGSDPTMIDVIASAIGASNQNYGVSNYDQSSPIMDNVSLTASGSITTNIALVQSLTSTAIIRDSTLSGAEFSIDNSSPNDTAMVTTSQLDGPISSGVTCLDSHDGAGDALDTSCQAIGTGKAVTWDDVDGIQAGFHEMLSTPTEAFIPAGPFQMGCDPAHNGVYSCVSDELPLHTVTLSSYYIDKYEVTNADYKVCVAAGECTAPSNTTAYNDAAKVNHPVVEVDWNQADAYCTWAGGRLPTEAEWEKAARGPTIQTYPWGDDSPTCDLANFYDNGYCVGDTAAVGSYPSGASPYGVQDMAGNVWEWVNDWYQSDYYSVSPDTDPQGPASETYKLLRGGSWLDGVRYVRAADRNWLPPGNTNNDFGFRCARSP